MSGELSPPSKYLGLPMVVMSVLVLTSDIFLVICTSVSNLHLCYVKTALLFTKLESTNFFKSIINATSLHQLRSHDKNLEFITRWDGLFPVCCLSSISYFFILTVLSLDFMFWLCQEFRKLLPSLYKSQHHHRHHVFFRFVAVKKLTKGIKQNYGCKSRYLQKLDIKIIF